MPPSLKLLMLLLKLWSSSNQYTHNVGTNCIRIYVLYCIKYLLKCFVVFEIAFLKMYYRCTLKNIMFTFESIDAVRCREIRHIREKAKKKKFYFSILVHKNNECVAGEVCKLTFYSVSMFSYVIFFFL